MNKTTYRDKASVVSLTQAEKDTIREIIEHMNEVSNSSNKT
jgi:hypothetical protein